MRHVVGADRVRTGAGGHAGAIVIENGRIAGVPDPGSEPPDLDRRPGVLIPALSDAHLHPVALAGLELDLDLRSIESLAEVRERISQRSASLPPGRPLVATGLDDTRLREGRLPDRTDLDRAAPGRPVLVHRICGHVAVASTPTLDLAGIGPDTIDPPGGSFDRADGELTGVARETAVDLVAAPIVASSPGPGPEEILAACRRLLATGMTVVTGMISTGVGGWCGGRDELTPLLAAAGDLPVDVDVLVITADPSDLRSAAERIEQAGSRLRFLGWKGFADGSLGARTAHLRRPYADRAGARGSPRLDPRAGELARTAVELGGRVAVHAIGDAAVDRVVDLFGAMVDEGAPGNRLRVEHASLVSEDAIQAIAGMGAVASIQPSFLASDAPWLEKRLGSERLGDAYPFRRLADAGALLAGGSDAPVEPADPWAGMASARHRPVDGLPGLSAAESFALYAEGSFLAAGRPAPLTPGAPADFLVVSRDPAGVDDPARIEVREVWCRGRRVI